jgi:signal transduction histidine kinase
MLDTTLDLAEAEAGALHMNHSPVDFSDVVRQLTDIYHPAMAERHHELTVDLEDNVIVDADPSLLNRVVSNLLENELTHLPEGCRVSVRLHSHQGSAELVIEDDGPGFPPDIGSRAFERFVKGSHSPGHGLGLAFRGCSCPCPRRLGFGMMVARDGVEPPTPAFSGLRFVVLSTT